MAPDWENVSRDPDEVVDLGYDRLKLDILPTLIEGESRIIVLPADEELLRDDAFLIADEDVVRDLGEML